MRYVNNDKVSKSMLKGVNSEDGGAFIFYQSEGFLYWIYLKRNEDKLKENRVKIPFEADLSQDYHMMKRNGKIYIYMVSQKK